MLLWATVTSHRVAKRILALPLTGKECDEHSRLKEIFALVLPGFYRRGRRLCLLGAGGPIHRDSWFEPITRRVDAIELDLWPSLALRAAPLIGVGLVLWVLSGLVGGLADALIGTALLYFAWGREDYPTDLEKLLARSRVGDVEGAEMLLGETAPLALGGIARGPCAP